MSLGHYYSFVLDIDSEIDVIEYAVTQSHWMSLSEKHQIIAVGLARVANARNCTPYERQCAHNRVISILRRINEEERQMIEQFENRNTNQSSDVPIVEVIADSDKSDDIPFATYANT